MDGKTDSGENSKMRKIPKRKTGEIEEKYKRKNTKEKKIRKK